jgi:hypothetical protein
MSSSRAVEVEGSIGLVPGGNWKDIISNLDMLCYQNISDVYFAYGNWEGCAGLEALNE